MVVSGLCVKSANSRGSMSGLSSKTFLFLSVGVVQFCSRVGTGKNWKLRGIRNTFLCYHVNSRRLPSTN